MRCDLIVRISFHFNADNSYGLLWLQVKQKAKTLRSQHSPSAQLGKGEIPPTDQQQKPSAPGIFRALSGEKVEPPPNAEQAKFHALIWT